MNNDAADAYEHHAREFLQVRDKSTLGIAVIERWARQLARGSDVLEIAYGGGFPVTRALQESGLKIWAVDASPSLMAKFQARFPNIPVQCAKVQESDFFERRFDATVAIGLLFLLDRDDQLALIRRISKLLVPGGRFLFTAPEEAGVWRDTTTGHECVSLDRHKYEAALRESNFMLAGRYLDEGQNNHYDALYRPVHTAAS